jgi:hypothetical protein
MGKVNDNPNDFETERRRVLMKIIIEYGYSEYDNSPVYDIWIPSEYENVKL